MESRIGFGEKDCGFGGGSAYGSGNKECNGYGYGSPSSYDEDCCYGYGIVKINGYGISYNGSTPFFAFKMENNIVECGLVKKGFNIEKIYLAKVGILGKWAFGETKQKAIENAVYMFCKDIASGTSEKISNDIEGLIFENMEDITLKSLDKNNMIDKSLFQKQILNKINENIESFVKYATKNIV